MLPRNLRLSREDFDKTPQLRRFTSIHLALSFDEGSFKGGCGVVVSKKVAKLSVARHLLKRRIKAIARPWCSRSRTILVYARGDAAALPFPELKAELESLLQKAFPSGANAGTILV